MSDLIRNRRALRCAALCLSTILVSGLAAPAFAQSDPQASTPSVYQPIDPRGVDVYSGTFNSNHTDVSIGDLAYERYYRGNGFRDIFQGGISTTMPNGNIYQVGFGGASETFTLTGVLGSGTFTQDQGSGSTLTYASGTFTYKTREGIIYTTDVGRIYPVSITYPDGTVDTPILKTISWCRDIGDQCLPRISTRLQQVMRSNGYALKFDYASNVVPDQTAAEWLRLTKVTAFNAGTDSCSGLSDVCGFTQAWPYVSYGKSTVGANTVRTVTDPLNRTISYTFNSSNRLIAIKRPSSPTDNVTIGYAATGKVQSVNVEGVNWIYAFVDSGSTRTSTVTNALNQTRTVVSNLTIGRASSETDPLNRTTNYAYDSSGRLTRATAPEGNYSQVTYDARGNVTQTEIVAKPGSGLATITTSASFDATCANFKTCNKPNSTTDAMGNVTNYTYDATTGFVTSITLPAAAPGGVRPQQRQSYVGNYAWYKNSVGTIIQAAAPIYKLTSSSSCQTTVSCAAALDEIKSLSSIKRDQQALRATFFHSR